MHIPTTLRQKCSSTVRNMGGAGNGAPRVLEDVVALVMCQDPVANAKAAVTARIEGHGGRVVARLGKDVSHIVWERTRSRRPSDKAADEAQLLELFNKLEKVGRGAERGKWMLLACIAPRLQDAALPPALAQLEYPPVVVSPLWVEESIKSGRRLVERKYLVGWWRWDWGLPGWPRGRPEGHSLLCDGPAAQLCLNAC